MYIRNNRGYTTVLVCALIPLIIIVLGLCIDGTFIYYSQAKLMTATKYAAISATTLYREENDEIIIIEDRDFIRACLKKNYDVAELDNFYIDEIDKNKCTLTTKAEIPLYFLPLLLKDKRSILLHESYTAQREK